MENEGRHVYGVHSDRSKSQMTADWDLLGPLINTANLTPAAGADTQSTISMYTPAAASMDDTGNYEQLSLYNGRREGFNLQPDSHLMCLKLGKRHYFGENFPVMGEREVPADYYASKKVKPSGGHVWRSVPEAVVPRCQVEGCYVELGNAKDYHRRHKVCEMHSKAPKVIVLGLEQRFCQQCSRFHVVSEFDESKRSCRRRLAGHNERRRKGNQDFISKNSYHEKLISSPESANALSLLSTNQNICTSSDLSSRSSAALRELIAEHRAAILSKHLQHNSIQDSPNNYDHHQYHHTTQACNYNFNKTCSSFFSNDHHDHRFQDDDDGAVTLDLMQTQSASPFGFLSRDHKDIKEEGDEDAEEEEECSVLWNTWNGVCED